MFPVNAIIMPFDKKKMGFNKLLYEDCQVNVRRMNFTQRRKEISRKDAAKTLCGAASLRDISLRETKKLDHSPGLAKNLLNNLYQHFASFLYLLFRPGQADSC